MRVLDLRNRDVRQFGKYIVVGGGNTMLTLAVIFLLKSEFGVNLWLSNAVGYAAGMVNSFVWNKLWVFRSRGGRISGEAFRFLTGFAVCYAVQFAVTWLFTLVLGHGEWSLPGGFVLSGYGFATLIGMCAYTVSNYVYNRIVTFRN